MLLTTAMMQQYVGGQLEIINDTENYRYRGQIKSIEVIDDPGPPFPGGGQQAALHVEFDYICKFNYNEGYKPDENKPYNLSLLISGANDIGMENLFSLAVEF